MIGRCRDKTAILVPCHLNPPTARPPPRRPRRPGRNSLCPSAQPLPGDCRSAGRRGRAVPLIGWDILGARAYGVHLEVRAALLLRHCRGIDFNDTGAPDYPDFAYLAFTIGMTFQVSDTNIQSRQIRRTVLRHAWLSFPLVAVIIATSINLVSGLAK